MRLRKNLKQGEPNYMDTMSSSKKIIIEEAINFIVAYKASKDVIIDLII